MFDLWPVRQVLFHSVILTASASVAAKRLFALVSVYPRLCYTIRLLICRILGRGLLSSATHSPIVLRIQSSASPPSAHDAIDATLQHCHYQVSASRVQRPPLMPTSPVASEPLSCCSSLPELQFDQSLSQFLCACRPAIR